MNRETIIKKMRDIDLIDFRDEDEDEHVAELVNKVSSIVALAVAKEREECGWQPIEAAPKDGRKVILFYTNQNKMPRTVMANWLTQEQAEEIDDDGVGLESGWYECIDNWDIYSHVAIHEGEPTHWMKLPPNPDAIRARGEA